MLKNRGPFTSKIKFINDTSEPLLGLADFIAGSIRSFLDNETHTFSKLIHNLFKSKIVEIHKTK